MRTDELPLEDSQNSIPRVGLSYRYPIGGWIRTKPKEIQCLEIIAEHFFEARDESLQSLRASYPPFVHGLGLSLGTPGPIHQETLKNFQRVVHLADPEWISEHVAFTRSDEVELGHLNPIAPTEQTLNVLVVHARELSDVCQKPLILDFMSNNATDAKLLFGRKRRNAKVPVQYPARNVRRNFSAIVFAPCHHGAVRSSSTLDERWLNVARLLGGWVKFHWGG